jgi:hypothetical protein
VRTFGFEWWSIAVAMGVVGLVGCSREREVRLLVRWDFTASGACGAPGHEDTAGEKEITLRYTTAPDHFETLCSTRLANHLAAVGTNPVEAMFRYDSSTGGRSLCELDGVAGTPLASGGKLTCTGLGHQGGGVSSMGGRAPGPSPFGAAK